MFLANRRRVRSAYQGIRLRRGQSEWRRFVRKRDAAKPPAAPPEPTSERKE